MRTKQICEDMYEDLARENYGPASAVTSGGVQQDPNLLLPDGVHPNEAGAKVVEKNVWKALQPLLPTTKKKP